MQKPQLVIDAFGANHKRRDLGRALLEGMQSEAVRWRY